MKDPNNGVCVTKGCKMFILLNWTSGDEDEGEDKALL